MNSGRGWSWLFLCIIFLIACAPVHYTVPKGYKPCRTDWDCAETQICWFHGVDTYAVCIEDPDK